MRRCCLLPASSSLSRPGGRVQVGAEPSHQRITVCFVLISVFLLLLGPFGLRRPAHESQCLSGDATGVRQPVKRKQAPNESTKSKPRKVTTNTLKTSTGRQQTGTNQRATHKSALCRGTDGSPTVHAHPPIAASAPKCFHSSSSLSGASQL